MKESTADSILCRGWQPLTSPRWLSADALMLVVRLGILLFFEK